MQQPAASPSFTPEQLVAIDALKKRKEVAVAFPAVVLQFLRVAQNYNSCFAARCMTWAGARNSVLGLAGGGVASLLLPSEQRSAYRMSSL
jgi:hypothetical protein